MTHPSDIWITRIFRVFFIYIPAALLWLLLIAKVLVYDPNRQPEGIHYTSYKAEDSNGSSSNLFFYAAHEGEIYQGPDINGWGLKAKFTDEDADGVADLIVTDSRGGRLVFLISKKYSKSTLVFKLKEKKGDFIVHYPEGHLWGA
jgi:hypothetical protein